MSENATFLNGTDALDDILNGLKRDLAADTSKYAYAFGANETADSLRCPNEREQKKYLLQMLRHLRLGPNMESVLTTKIYRSIKGEIRKGHFDNVWNFFSNIGHGHLKQVFDQYASSRTILDIQVPVICPAPVSVCTIEIDLK